MSVLIGHARAARIMHDAFADEAEGMKRDPHGEARYGKDTIQTMYAMARVYGDAADRMEAEMKADAAGDAGIKEAR